METKTLSFLFMLFLLLAADFTVKTAEARKCVSQSHRFHGPCLRDSNCVTVCLGEGFTGGNCHGFRRRCFCSRFC
ncbi:unnamed protein product [Lathyrus oleraceus]